MSALSLRQRYEEDGCLVLRSVLDAELVAVADAHVDWLLERHPDRGPEELGHDLARHDPFWVRLVSDPRLLDIAAVFLGPDLALFATHYICKPPRTGRPVRWHQDGAFWPLDPMEVITLWLAITPSTTENGCLRVIPRSHRTGLQAMRPTDGAVLASEIDGDVDESGAVDLVLEPGDVSIHHPNIVHASDRNTSPSWRRGLTIRCIPTSTRITDPDAASPLLLRGAARPGVNEYLPWPAFDPERHMPFAGVEAWPP
ncbi:MAG: phytanoyl-CoA dioxygenase family protein [Nitriliruptorales bacterium]